MPSSSINISIRSAAIIIIFVSATICQSQVSTPVNTNSNVISYKENRCLQTGRWMGIAAGTGVGLLHTYWLATDLTDDQINWSKSLIAGIPSTIVSTYVGTKNIRMDHKTDHEG